MKVLDYTGLQTLVNKIKGLIDKKVEKVDGKGLSTNDYTNTEKQKLSGYETLSSDNTNLYGRKQTTGFNNATKTGLYTITSNTGAPFTNYTYWSNITLNSTSVDSSSYMQQIAMSEKADDKAIYFRKKQSSTTTPWMKLAPAENSFNGGVDVPLSAEMGKKLYNEKVDKVSGKGLSSNDFTTEYKNKLDQLKVQVVLTEAEYNALSTSQKNDPNYLYFFKVS